MKTRLPRSTPLVVLVAVACLMLGSAGGAVAGSLITGKQIKNGTVTGADIKNRSLAVQDLSKPAVAGLRGKQGPRGLNAWDTIPSGKTVTGRFYDSGRSGNAGSTVIENVEFPAKAPAAPTGLGFGGTSFPAGAPADSSCTGTFDHPTAPRGHVCVYLQQATDLTDAYVSSWGSPAQQPYAFYLYFYEGAANTSWTYWGSWAYTAP